MLPPLLGDIEASHIAGAAGWTGTGLLGGVLYWIAFHYLPGMNKFIKELIAHNAEQIAKLIESHDKKSAAEREHSQANINRVTEHCEKELRTITDALTSKLKEVSDQVAEHREESRDLHQQARLHVNNIAHAVRLKVAAGGIEVRDGKSPGT